MSMLPHPRCAQSRGQNAPDPESSELSNSDHAAEVSTQSSVPASSAEDRTEGSVTIAGCRFSSREAAGPVH